MILILVFAESRLGKKIIADSIENVSTKTARIKISVKEIRGDFFRRVTFDGVALRSIDGVEIAKMKAIVLDLDLLKLKVKKVQIEQPELYAVPKGKPSRGNQHNQNFQAMMKHFYEINLVEGRFKSIYPIQAHLFLGKQPRAQVLADGHYFGLPLHVEALLGDLVPSAQALSAIQKLPGVAVQNAQYIRLSASLGRSKGEFDAEGLFKFFDINESRANINLAHFHLESNELRLKHIIALPRDLDGHASFLTHGSRVDGKSEIQIRRRGKISIEASLVPQGVVELNKFEIFNSRANNLSPLLKLEKRSRLTFDQNRLLPTAKLRLSGSAGSIQIVTLRHRTKLALKNFEPGKVSHSLGFGESREFGKLTGKINFPVNANVEWTVPQGQFNVRAAFIGKTQDLNLNSFKVKAHVDFRSQKLNANSEIEILAKNSRAKFRAHSHGLQKELQIFYDAEASGEGFSLNGPLGAAKAQLQASFLSHDKTIARLWAKTRGGKLSGRIIANDVDIDSVLPLLTDDVRTENGILNANAMLSGTLSEPRSYGTLRVDAQRLVVPVLGTSYDGLKIDISGDDKKLNVNQFAVSSGSGSIDAKGSFLQASSIFEINGSFKDFEVYSDDTVLAHASGDLNLHANTRDLSFRGGLKTTGGRITLLARKNKKSLESLSALSDVVMSNEKPQFPNQPHALPHKIHGSIDVSVPPGFLLVSEDKSINMNLASELKAGLDQESDFFVTGLVRTVRGDAELFGRRLAIEPSTATFEGDPTLPIVNLAALYRVSPRNILVRVTGSPDDLKPHLESDPPGYSQDQCIGVLLTGSPDFQNKVESGGRSPGSLAGGLASGFLLGKLKNFLGKALPIDTLTADFGSGDSGESSAVKPRLRESVNAVTPSGQPIEDSSRNRIEAGKYLSDRIFVKLGHLFPTGDEPAASKLTLDYRISDRWSLSSSETDQGQSDLQMLWTLNY